MGERAGLLRELSKCHSQKSSKIGYKKIYALLTKNRPHKFFAWICLISEQKEKRATTTNNAS